jgi:hypothetical protein
VENLRKLLGENWINREVVCAEPTHLLGRWYKKDPDNPVTRHVERLLDYILNRDGVRCDAERLGAKVKGEFLDTLVEMDYAVFLGERGLQVTMEPCAPDAGPDLLAVRDFEYFIEIKRVRLDEARAAADAATEDVFRRLCQTPSRYSIIISMTDEYTAYSAQLKGAVRAVAQVLRELGERNVQEATLYYRGPKDRTVANGPEGEPLFDYSDAHKLAAQVDQLEQRRNTRFVARFNDTGADSPRTVVAVHPLGPNPGLLVPDETYLRLRDILKKKREQLPRGSRGLVLLDMTDLTKLMIDQETIQRAVYGDLVFRVRQKPDGGFEDDMFRKPNGFFMRTSRMSAVVVQQTSLSDVGIEARREVFPTNNPQSRVLSLDELKLFGQIAPGLEHLSAERLGEHA